MKLENRTAVVTGGASGIGRAIAIAFAEEGANVAIGDIQRLPKNSDTSTVEKIEEAGSNAIFVETNVARQDDCRALVEAAADAFGGVDVLVNNAGGFPPESRGKNIAELPEDEWDNIIDVNLKGAYNCCHCALPYIEESSAGRIINVASKMGLVGHPNAPAYSAAKGAVVNLTRQVAIDYADESVTVNTLTPGIIVTGTKGYRFEDKADRMRDNTPLPFLGESEDIAGAAVYLASEEARFVTGHNLVVDGGWTAQ
ncbi:MAG: SDR family NAD(P)-dependent oxidoreductase [Halobacteriota archaeon]